MAYVPRPSDKLLYTTLYISLKSLFAKGNWTLLQCNKGMAIFFLVYEYYKRPVFE